MRARHVGGERVEALLDPEHPAWRRAAGERLRLVGTPAGLQPNAYLRAAWSDPEIGAVGTVRVAAIHNGEALAFRLEWQDPHEDGPPTDPTHFPDAAAVLLPAAPGASVMTMGAPGAAVNAWYWRADKAERGRHVVSEGLGTTRTVDTELVRTGGAWKEGRWRVVIARALRVAGKDPVAQLAPRRETGVAFAVWEGSHRERAGIKAFSGDWRPLRLVAQPGAEG